MISRRSFIAGLAAAGTACRSHPEEPGRDRPLVIVFGPLHAPSHPDALRASLEQASKLKLELVASESSPAAIDLVQAGKADAALLPLFDFLLCAELFGVQPLAQLVRSGDRTTQAGDLVVLADSPLRALSDLRARRIGYVDRYSVTGFILPAAELSEADVTVEAVWLGSHDAVLAAVRDGTVAAGATYSGHAATEAGLRVLASTKPIANEPLFVQPSVPQAVREALRAALLAEHDAAALAGLADASGFRAPGDGRYDAALVTLKAAGRRAEDVVPGGWPRANEHRRPLWSYAP